VHPRPTEELKSGDQKCALEMEFHWQIAVELDEQCILSHHSLFPVLRVDFKRISQFHFIVVESFKAD